MAFAREKFDYSSYKMPFVLPKVGEHPRLFLKKEDIGTLKSNFAKPQNICAAHEFKKLCDKEAKLRLGGVDEDGKNISPKILARIEALAFSYVLYDDAQAARIAIAAIKDYIKSMEFGNYCDYTRPIGHAIFTAAEVYDWCYALLTDEDKREIIALCEKRATELEMGYPPTGQGAVVGHGSEAQLLRDLLAFSVAVYDECDDIYKFCAGRIIDEFVPVRNYFARAHMHYQGSAYGFYRYTFELWAQAIIYKMSGQSLFGNEHGKMAYEWIYIRRPDGQFLRIGDDFAETKLYQNQYWDEDYPAMLLASNLYKDEYLKQAAIRASEAFGRFIYDNMTLTPVQYLLINDPDLWGRPIDELAKTKYFASPEGLMVARTSWDMDINTDKYGNEDINADSVIAYMRIGERYTANHQHLDAGNFQLYYKGILASESGCYDSYYTPHDKCYNKETIAHNTILIYDPDEVFDERVNCGGQRRPTGGEPLTLEAVMSEEFATGKVLAHAFGPDKLTPAYSYISGDIARAYTSKAKEVIRSMAFMPHKGSHKGVMFVGDKITVAKPSFKKTFLLHTQEEPLLEDDAIFVINTSAEHRGAMQLHMVLPKAKCVRKIGGEGMEYTINGVNYPLKGEYEHRALEAGAWRIEISPEGENATDYMLNVLLAGDIKGNDSSASVYEIESESHFGAQVYDKACLFNKNAEKVSEIEFEIADTGYKSYNVLVCGMLAGEYELENAGKTCVAYASEEGGELWLEAESGSVKIRKK